MKIILQRVKTFENGDILITLTNQCTTHTRDYWVFDNKVYWLGLQVSDKTHLSNEDKSFYEALKDLLVLENI